MTDATISSLQECCPENLIQSLKYLNIRRKNHKGQESMTYYHHNVQNDQTKSKFQSQQEK